MRQISVTGWLLSCVALLVASGCGRTVTHLDPTAASTWEALNRKTEADSVVVTLSGGDALPVRDPRFTPDFAHWADPASGEERSVPSVDLARVSCRDEWRGIRAGLRFGLVTGGTLTAAALFAIGGGGDPFGKALALGGGLAVTGVLSLVGAAIGGVDGGWEDFVLHGGPEPDEGAAGDAEGPE